MGDASSLPLKIRLKAYDVFGSLRGVVPEWAELEYTDKLNDLPTLTVKVATGSLAAKRLHAPVEIALEVNHGGEWIEPTNCRFISTGVDTDLVDAGAYLTVPCLGVGLALRWATVWEPTPGDKDGKRVFAASSPGKIINTLFQAAAARNDNNLAWGKGNIAWDITDSADTEHAAWGKNASPQFATSATLYSVMGWLAGKGALDWRFQARTMQAYKTNGGMARDKNSMVLRAAFSTSLPLKTDLQNVVTTAKFRGNEGFEKVKSSTDAYRTLGRIEAFSEQGQVSTDATATLYLDEILLRGHRPAREYRREYQLTIGEYAPFLWRDYLVGDWVSNGDETLRIVEAGIKADTDGTIKGWETLGSRIDSYLERLGRKTTNLESGAVGSDSGKPLPSGQDTRQPKHPEGVTSDTNITVTSDGIYRGIVTVNWRAVTKATNNTPIEIDRYLVCSRREGEDSYRIVAETQDNAVSASFYADPGDNLAVFVVAVSKANQRSTPSDTVRVDVTKDTTPPPVPSVPVLEAKLGVIHAKWDEQDRDGEAMPPDFKTLEVEVIDPDLSTESSSSLPIGQSAWVYPTKKYGDYKVRIRAVDNAGNKSDWSEKATVNVVSLVDASGISDEINAAKQEFSNQFDEKIGETTSSLSGEIRAKIDAAKQEFANTPVPLERLRAGGDANREFMKALLADRVFAQEFYANQLIVSRFNNLVRDPEFRNPDAWFAIPEEAVTFTGGQCEIDASKVRDVVNVQNSPWGISPVTPGERYVASVFVKSKNSTSIPKNSVALFVMFHDYDHRHRESSNALPPLPNSSTITSSGVELKTEFVVPENIVGATLYLASRNLPADSVLVFSDPRLYQQVGATMIQDGAITTDKIQAGAVDAGKIKANSITGEKIQANTITGEKILANSITGEKIKAYSITGDKIRANAISGDKIRANTITGEKLLANSITGEKIKAYSISGDKIQGNTITGDKIQAGSIGAAQLKADSIKAKHIQSDAIDGMTIRGAKLIGTQIQTNNNSSIGVKLNDNSMRVGDSSGREVFRLDSRGGDTVWTAPGSPNNITIDPTSYRDRVSLLFNTDWLNGWDIKPNMFAVSRSEHNYNNAFDAGSFVINGAERHVNSSGRVDLRIGPGTRFYLGTAYGYDSQQAFINSEDGNVSLYAGDSVMIKARNNVTIVPGGNYITAKFTGGMTEISTELKVTGMRQSTTSLNVGLGTNWTLYYGSSARRYKIDIKDYKAEGINPEAILELAPKTWYDRTQMEDYANYLEDSSPEGLHTGKWDYMNKMPARVPGLIAEEVEAVGLTQYLTRSIDGDKIEGLQYDRLWTLLIPVVKDLRDRITMLERRNHDERKQQ